MLRYTLRRVVLIPVTFFFVSLVLFAVLNVAPGQPGAAGNGLESSSRGEQRDSYRLFKAQFGLDKPIALNTRSWITREQVTEWLSAAYALETKPNATPNAEKMVSAQERLDESGVYLVRHLVPLLDHPRYAAAARDVLPWATGVGPLTDVEWRQHFDSHRTRYEWTGLDRLESLFFDTRFAKWWGNLIRLDFGLSIVDRQPVVDAIIARLGCTLSLTGLSLGLAYLIAVPLGVFSAARHGTSTDTVLTTLVFVLFAVPTFFSGTLLLQVFSEQLRWFPPGGFRSVDSSGLTTSEQLFDVLWHMCLPVTTYAAAILAVVSRYARGGVVDVIRSDYVRTARAKGLPEWRVIAKHAAPNGMLPILTLLGSLLPLLVSGSVVIEVIFNLPGMGLYLFDSINLRDYNAVMGVLFVVSFLTLIGVLLSDLLYAAVDPRISLG